MGILKILFFMVVLFLFILTNPLFASVKEDTVHLSFEKTALSEEKSSEYTVKKRDHLLGIIQRKYGGSKKENLNILKEVGRLNPTIKNVNLIYPGQRVILPRTVAEEEASETKEEEKTTSTYVVKGGDSIVKIVSSELGLSLAEGYKMLGAVSLLNPGISDLNRIYPGQKIIIPAKGKLPDKAKEVLSQTKMAKARFLSRENQLSILKYIFGRTGGSIIAEGNFYIPLSPQGQIGVDCSQVPVAELDNGKTVLMDFSNRIPQNVKKIVESTWKNYSIISGTGNGEPISVLEKLLDTSDMYTLRRKSNYMTLGSGNLLRIFIDWIVRWEGGDVPYSFCINFVDLESAALPGNVRSYAMKNGYDLMEVSEDSVVVDFEMPYQSMSVSSLNKGSTRELTESLLSTLGYSASRDAGVRIFTIEDDGFNLSVKADLMVEVEKGAMIFNFERLPAQFTDILMDRGISVVYLSEEEGKRKTIERVLHATGCSFEFDTYKFPFSEKGGRTMGDISFPALKIENGDNTVYLIDYEMDSDIYGLLYGKWEVKLLNY